MELRWDWTFRSIFSPKIIPISRNTNTNVYNSHYSMISVGFEFRIFATIRSGAYIRTIRLDSNFEYSPLFGRKRIFACVITIRKRSQVTEYRIFEIRWTALVYIHAYYKYYLQYERPCCIGHTTSRPRLDFAYPIQHDRSYSK